MGKALLGVSPVPRNDGWNLRGALRNAFTKVTLG
jgi:hypothetical protein